MKKIKKLAPLRSSSLTFNIETRIRSCLRHISALNRICYQCCDKETIGNLAELPFFEPINEDEEHVLRVCPTYTEFRESLTEAARVCLFNDIAAFLKDRSYILEAAKMLVRIDARRFHKKSLESAALQ